MIEFMFSSVTALSNRWTRGISFDWSHSGGCSGSCNAYYVLLFQVTIVDTRLVVHTNIVTLKYRLSNTINWLSLKPTLCPPTWQLSWKIIWQEFLMCMCMFVIWFYKLNLFVFFCFGRVLLNSSTLELGMLWQCCLTLQTTKVTQLHRWKSELQ